MAKALNFTSGMAMLDSMLDYVENNRTVFSEWCAERAISGDDVRAQGSRAGAITPATWPPVVPLKPILLTSYW